MAQIVERKLASPLANEYLPFMTTDPTEVTISNLASISAMWDANPSTMRGVAAGSPNAFTWSDRVKLVPATLAVTGQAPIAATDATTGQGFLQFGYGTGLSQRSTTAIVAAINLGGTGHAANDVITLTDGTVLKVATTVSGAVASATVVSSATYTSAPANPVSQASTTGSGTGAKFDIDCGAPNGSLVTSPVKSLINIANPVTLIAVARAPTVGGRAGATPGGMIFGNQLPQSSYADAGANPRSLSLSIGYGVNGGRGIFRAVGEAKFAAGATAVDYRDDKWHLHMGGATPSAGSSTPAYWVDGHLVSSTTYTSLALNTSAGNDKFRIGAAGAQGLAANYGFAGDIAFATALTGIDLTVAGSTATRQLIQNWLMGRFGITGTSD